MPDMPAQDALRGVPSVSSLEELVEFLAAVEAVCGPDDRVRPPTLGDRFLL